MGVGGTRTDKERGMDAFHHVGITFQKKAAKGASSLKRAGLRAEEESVSIVLRLKGVGRGLA